MVPKIFRNFRSESRRKMRRIARKTSRRHSESHLRTCVDASEAGRRPATLISARSCVILSEYFCGPENFQKWESSLSTRHSAGIFIRAPYCTSETSPSCFAPSFVKAHILIQPRSGIPVFQAPGRVLGPPAVLGDHMGAAATKAEIKNSTARRGSAYSTKNRALQKSLRQDGERH